MVKIGDSVRYLNAVGGGIVTRVEGKIAYVMDDGFENPVLATELVVVVPAGHQPSGPVAAAKMFNQEAFDAGRSRKEEPAVEPARPMASSAPVAPAPETAHGDKLSIALAFEPSSTKNLAQATFNAVLVNDSNYCLDFVFSRCAEGDKAWTVVFRGTLPANELVDLAQYTHENLGEIERVSLQAIAYKEGKEFEIKPPVNVSRRLDLTKFHKLHCFRAGIYFDTPVLELQLMKDDIEPGAAAHRPEKQDLQQLQKKWNADVPKKVKKVETKKVSPTALLPIIEIDLHIHELVDTTAGMENKDMLLLQLDAVRSAMKEHARRIGQKIVFIHGKGDGVLRKEVLSLLKKEFPRATTQDASFREYGFGATLVTIK